METTQFVILRREEHTAIWLETSSDLHSAKHRIKQIASFWPGRYEVVEHHSQRTVATLAPSRLRTPLHRIRQLAGRSLRTSYAWLLAPAPQTRALASFAGVRRTFYQAGWAWLCSPASRLQVYRIR